MGLGSRDVCASGEVSALTGQECDVYFWICGAPAEEGRELVVKVLG